MLKIKGDNSLLNSFKPEFTIVIFIHYKPRIAVAILAVDQDQLNCAANGNKIVVI